MTITRRASMFLAAATTALLMTNAASAESAHKEKIRLFYDTFVTGNADLLDQVLAEDWANVPTNPGQGPGRDGFKAMRDGQHRQPRVGTMLRSGGLYCFCQVTQTKQPPANSVRFRLLNRKLFIVFDRDNDNFDDANSGRRTRSIVCETRWRT